MWAHSDNHSGCSPGHQWRATCRGRRLRRSVRRGLQWSAVLLARSTTVLGGTCPVLAVVFSHWGPAEQGVAFRHFRRQPPRPVETVGRGWATGCRQSNGTRDSIPTRYSPQTSILLALRRPDGCESIGTWSGGAVSVLNSVESELTYPGRKSHCAGSDRSNCLMHQIGGE